MNREKVKQAIIHQTSVVYDGDVWNINAVHSTIINGEWYSKLFLYSSEKKQGTLAEVKDVSGGVYL